MVEGKLCLILCFFAASLFAQPSHGEVKKINGQNAIELPLYRTKHPVQSLLEFAEKRGYANIQNLNGSESLMDILKNIKVPVSQKKGVKNETIAIFKKYDTDFYTEIRIGQPSNKLYKLLVDTSWADSWVVSSKCQAWVCVIKNKYDAESSKTAHPDGRNFYVDFGKGTFGGNLTGNLAIDTVYFAHFNATNVTFAEVSDIPWFMLFSRYDGILGMGRATEKLSGAPLIWKELIRQNKIKKNIFSIYYNRDPSVDRAGAFMIGAMDPHHYNGSTATEVEVTGDLYWEFKIKDLIFSRIKKAPKRKALLHFCENFCNAKMDSGGNTISGPASDIKKINDLIGAQPFFFGFNRIPCENIAKLPELIFLFGNRNLTLYGQHYTQQIYYNGYVVCLSTFTSGETNTWSFGAPLLAKYYTVYDLDKGTISVTDYKTS